MLTTGFEMELASTILELAGILGVDRNRISALRFHELAPAEREDKLFDVEEWRDFLDSLKTDEEIHGEHDAEYRRLKNENLRLKNELTRFDLKKKQGSLLTIGEHLEEVREILEHCKWVVVTIPTRVALLTTDGGIRESIRRLCAHVEEEFQSRLIRATEKADDAERITLAAEVETTTPDENENMAGA